MDPVKKPITREVLNEWINWTPKSFRQYIYLLRYKIGMFFLPDNYRQFIFAYNRSFFKIHLEDIEKKEALLKEGTLGEVEDKFPLKAKGE